MDSLIRLATLPGQDWRSKQLFQWRHEEPFSGAKPKFVLGRYFWPNKFFPLVVVFLLQSEGEWHSAFLSLSLSFLLSQLSQAKIKSMLFTLSLRPLVTNNNNSSNSKKCELNWWTPAYYIVFYFGTDTYSFLTSWNRTNLATEVLVNKRKPPFFCCLKWNKCEYNSVPNEQQEVVL